MDRRLVPVEIPRGWSRLQLQTLHDVLVAEPKGDLAKSIVVVRALQFNLPDSQWSPEVFAAVVAACKNMRLLEVFTFYDANAAAVIGALEAQNHHRQPCPSLRGLRINWYRNTDRSMQILRQFNAVQTLWPSLDALSIPLRKPGLRLRPVRADFYSSFCADDGPEQLLKHSLKITVIDGTAEPWPLKVIRGGFTRLAIALNPAIGQRWVSPSLQAALSQHAIQVRVLKIEVNGRALARIQHDHCDMDLAPETQTRLRELTSGFIASCIFLHELWIGHQMWAWTDEFLESLPASVRLRVWLIGVGLQCPQDDNRVAPDPVTVNVDTIWGHVPLGMWVDVVANRLSRVQGLSRLHTLHLRIAVSSSAECVVRMLLDQALKPTLCRRRCSLKISFRQQV